MLRDETIFKLAISKKLLPCAVGIADLAAADYSSPPWEWDMYSITSKRPPDLAFLGSINSGLVKQPPLLDLACCFSAAWPSSIQANTIRNVLIAKYLDLPGLSFITFERST